MSDTPLPTTAADFERLFESAPISLWLEDWRALYRLLSQWRAQGVQDIEAHLRAAPERIAQCSACLKVLKVNQQTLKIFEAPSQQALIERLDEVFKEDTFEHMLTELKHLWAGQLDFSTQTVNYSLSGRRMDVQIHIRVLQGHEGDWERVMVSLEDITERLQARQQQALSEQYARSLFDHSPVSLWVEDFSSVKQLLDEARSQGIEDFRVFVSVHPDFVSRCAAQIRVLSVNRQTLKMFAADTQSQLLEQLARVFRDEMHISFTEQLMDLWNGITDQTREVVNYTLGGDLLNIHMQFSVLTGHEACWDRVLVSLVDITARKKAEAYLEYLGKHDSLTKLKNRAFYAIELNRHARSGAWPLSVLAMDLNGLKQVNDGQGHAAGDSLLRRVGEVLASAAANTPYCVARMGGDEFAALLPNCDERMAQSFKERIESLIEVNNQFYPGQKLSLALGVATIRETAHLDAGVHQADQAMYKSKARFHENSAIERRH